MRAGLVGIIALLALPTPVLAQAPAQTSAQEDPDQRVRCRSTEVTGSLARRERICRTVAEWRRLDNEGQNTARSMVDQISPCGECRGQ